MQRSPAIQPISNTLVRETGIDNLFNSIFRSADSTELPLATLTTNGESIKGVLNRLVAEDTPESYMSYLMLSTAFDFTSTRDTIKFVEVQTYIAKWMLPKLSAIELTYFAAINDFNDLLVAVHTKLEDDEDETVVFGEMLVFVMKFGAYWHKHNFMNAYRKYNGINTICGNVRAWSREEGTEGEGSEGRGGEAGTGNCALNLQETGFKESSGDSGNLRVPFYHYFQYLNDFWEPSRSVFSYHQYTHQPPLRTVADICLGASRASTAHLMRKQTLRPLNPHLRTSAPQHRRPSTSSIPDMYSQNHQKCGNSRLRTVGDSQPPQQIWEQPAYYIHGLYGKKVRSLDGIRQHHFAAATPKPASTRGKSEDLDREDSFPNEEDLIPGVLDDLLTPEEMMRRQSRVHVNSELPIPVPAANHPSDVRPISLQNILHVVNDAEPCDTLSQLQGFWHKNWSLQNRLFNLMADCAFEYTISRPQESVVVEAELRHMLVTRKLPSQSTVIGINKLRLALMMVLEREVTLAPLQKSTVYGEVLMFVMRFGADWQKYEALKLFRIWHGIPSADGDDIFDMSHHPDAPFVEGL
ncbi:uncharacterized protein BDZ99DRAFT_557531 [Mytilinidion resinicola]|uniref:Uncharacterized protein n=1 Tax=Mytilinidion resinicola TaxID=574789 RepID=A0A6A6YXD1_9PEZI|nr:uncharacterized protein BDZ99DRAFT_557531 [Mytilinidion resinicola]KAF2813606.1 hypothetical protein BDZ99DRAFT_557531 [Mytilinidion resinicola]